MRRFATIQKPNFKGTRVHPGWVALLCLALIFVPWITIRIYQQGRRIGAINSAVVTMRSLSSAETKFAEAHPEVGYTCVLSQLPPDEFVKNLNNRGERSDYAFSINGCETNGLKHGTYQITARPLISRLPAYCSDQSGILRMDESGSVSKCLQAGTTW